MSCRLIAFTSVFVPVLLSWPAEVINPGSDPAPPAFKALPSGTPAAMPQAFARLTSHAAPRPLAKNAVVEAWPRFLGAKDNGVTAERPLLKQWPEAGPKLLWEVAKGEGYASPSVAEGRVFLFHQFEGNEMLECLEAETGRKLWEHSYPIVYQDRYGYANGPRSSPVLADGKVYITGVTARFTCLDQKTGHVYWQRDLAEDFAVPQGFFGFGGAPLVLREQVILNLGGKINDKPAAVAAFHIKTGALLWSTPQEWGNSYASPLAATFHGKEKLVVLAGGESKPATGGLLIVDPASGKLDAAFPWRANKYESVIASTPVVIPGENRVFITETYRQGGIMLEVTPDFQLKPAWETKRFDCHFMTPVLHEGHLYAIAGEGENSAQLVCYEAKTGAEQWRESVDWEAEHGGRKLKLGLQRANLLRADGAFLALTEAGGLLWMDLTPKKATVLIKAQLFYAPQTWNTPVVSGGLLYINQNEPGLNDTARRLLCYDLRGQ